MAPKWQFGLLVAGAALVLAASTGERLRAQGAGVYELVAQHSGKCLDVSGASLDDRAHAVQWTCNGSSSQRWTIAPAADGHYRIVAQHSGKALGVLDGSQVYLAPVVQYSASDDASQLWRVEPASDGYYRFVARHSGMALSVDAWTLDDGREALQYPPYDYANQQWLLRSVSAQPPPPPPGETLSTADVVRFLEQSTFGPTPELIEHVRTVGFEAFLSEQFNAPMSSYPALPAVLTTRDTAACPNGSTCQRDNYTMYLLQNRFFTNALYGQDQLRQRVAFALHQIIVVSGLEVTLPFWMAPYLQILDRNAFGNYRDLLFEITLNPAMGNYLDITGNSRTRLDANGNVVAGPPNENYAREVLQLFSIGTFKLNLDGTQQLDANGQPIPSYGQEEVNNFARVFTGWVRATAPGPGIANYIDPMVVNANNHDTGAKTLLNGVVLPAGRNTLQDTNAGIDNIINDPNIGPYISKQLIQHLVTSNPTPAYVARVASVFNGQGTGVRGDLKGVIRAILLDPEARGDVRTEAGYGRLRHPAQFIANILRAFNARSRDLSTQSDGYLNPQSTGMGMDVFRPPSVFSYFSPFGGVPGGGGLRGPEFGLLSTSTALARANFVNTMIPPNSNAATGGINVSANAPNGTALDLSQLQALAPNPQALVAALDELLLHGTMSSEMRSSIVGAVSAVAATNSLKRARTAVYLVLTSPQYQVER